MISETPQLNTYVGKEDRALQDGRPRRRPFFRHVMVALDHSPYVAHVLEVASEFAGGLELPLTAARVITPGTWQAAAADPVQWELTMRAEETEIGGLLEEHGPAAHAEAVVLSGEVVATLCDAALERDADLLVIGTGARGAKGVWGLGGIARHLVEEFPGSLLVVPADVRHRPTGRTNAPRVVVALDWSASSKAALQTAAVIAERQEAELVLLHAVPEIAPAAAGPPEPEDMALRAEVRNRNIAQAKRHLEAVRRLIPSDRLRHRVRLMTHEEPRRALARAIEEEAADLLVLSVRGMGRNPDLPIGSTADYLVCSTRIPVLLVRQRQDHKPRRLGHAPSRPRAVPGLA